ncbi:hypothetical protein [Streptomyces sp. NPDC085596]|uniref:hypothetical protein n=1 Tax=Streptomyces sp. NPDC085596 TaxID=3365731 RepID=UPI0037D7C38A
MRTERSNLLACAHDSAERGCPDLVPFLQSLSGVRYLTGQDETAADLAHQAQTLCQELGDRLGEAQAL